MANLDGTYDFWKDVLPYFYKLLIHYIALLLIDQK